MNIRISFLAFFLLVFVVLVGIVITPCPSYAQAGLPDIRYSVAPALSRVAADAHVFGEVEVELVLNSQGSVQSATALRGHPFLRKGSEQALMRWRFAPAASQSRTLKLVFSYLYSIGNGVDQVRVSPYDLVLNVTPPKPIEPIEPPDTVSNIPQGWKPGVDKCGLHGTVLKQGRVGIEYGSMLFRGGYLDARESLFPNANSESYGGCVIETAGAKQISPKYALVLYCDQCRAAERTWSRAHRNEPFH